MKFEATISDDNMYRYTLSRIWDENKDLVMFLMLNPSTADDKVNDPTIRRCINYAKSWNYGGVLVTNLFAYRSTYPKKLLEISDPIGPENLNYLENLNERVSMCVCSWGKSLTVDKLLKKFPNYKPLSKINSHKLRYLELSKDGTPKHPLYLKKDILPNKYINEKDLYLKFY